MMMMGKEEASFKGIRERIALLMGWKNDRKKCPS